MTDTDVRHLLLIGAYRDNEVSSSHPLMHHARRNPRSGSKDAGHRAGATPPRANVT
jgi:predicted ATPase